MEAYIDENGRRRCCDCTAFLKSGVRTCGRCKTKAEKAEQKAADAKRRAMAFRDKGAGRWRKARLARYVHTVLSLSGAEREEYFTQHPVSDIFK